MKWLARRWARLFTSTWGTVRKWAARNENPLRLGQWGELQAVGFLRRRGYRIVARNVRTPLGELDVVALDGRCVVFVEVKTRRVDLSGDRQVLEISVDQAQRIVRAAHWYRRRHRLTPYPARLELCVVWVENGKPRVELVTHPWCELQDGDWIDA